VAERPLADAIEAAEVVLPCAELDATLLFFTERLGFRISAIFPADSPAVAVVVGHGLRVRLDRAAEGSPGVLRLLCRDPAALAGGATELLAPNGTRVVLAPANPPVRLPPLRPSFVVTRRSESAWSSGRAGMLYRDLVPDRQGGRIIASHIRIPDGGPVPDYVHYHRVRFQMIYCLQGWVRVVYEDQGPPFVLAAGDCALQPPEIRHRVLECSPGFEVIEVSSPAEHETLADLALELPTKDVRPDRLFGGQRFTRHAAAAAAFSPWRVAGFEARDLGIAAATDGLADARVVRRRAEPGSAADRVSLEAHDAELRFGFLLSGSTTLHAQGRAPQRLGAGDAFLIPPGHEHALRECGRDLELLELAVHPPRS
jgi:quercetin dioxygenase-like cupin family protein